MPYVPPKEVKSPRNSWTLIDVLQDGGENGLSLAIGEWEERRCFAMRWNGSDDRPVGNPQSRGLPTWFVMPDDYAELMLVKVPDEKRELALALLR